MTQNTDDRPAKSGAMELLDEVRDSAQAGQHAVAEALHAFRQVVDEAIPEAVQPLRSKIVDAAIELADKLAAAQYQLNRNLVRSAERALSSHDRDKD